ncbi:hypothetical protein PMZ80_009279 [Knufia obscura]|uniref:Uncharacterized protein n=1 Tax=Knufia obscura TaxID=1635080 RepID=A0ABR0RCE7_9EURO|nr:hypothetical protein PMZ80_009279 [Knufia obscura]
MLANRRRWRETRSRPWLSGASTRGKSQEMPEAPAGAAPLTSAVVQKGREGIAPRTELSRVPGATGFVRHTQAASRASGSKLPILATNPCLGISSEKQRSSCDQKSQCATGVDASRSLPMLRRRQKPSSGERKGAQLRCSQPAPRAVVEKDDGKPRRKPKTQSKRVAFDPVPRTKSTYSNDEYDRKSIYHDCCDAYGKHQLECNETEKPDKELISRFAWEGATSPWNTLDFWRYDNRVSLVYIGQVPRVRFDL